MESVIGEVLAFFLMVTAVAVLAFLGSLWGAYAAHESATSDSKKWKAYIVALLLPATLGLLALQEEHLTRFASQFTSVLAAGAVCGVLAAFPNRQKIR